MRAEGLEPTPLSGPEPKSGASASFATPAADHIISRSAAGARASHRSTATLHQGQRRSAEQGWGITSNLAHPGVAPTSLLAARPELGRSGDTAQIRVIRWLSARGLLVGTPRTAGLPALVAATDPDVRDGGTEHHDVARHDLALPCWRARRRLTSSRLITAETCLIAVSSWMPRPAASPALGSSSTLSYI